MAKGVNVGHRLWSGSLDASGFVNAMALDHGADPVDITTFADTTRIFAGGLRLVSASHAGLWDDPIDAELFASIGLATRPMTIQPAPIAEGNVAFGFLPMFADYSQGGKVGDAHAFGITAQAASELVRGVIGANRAGVTAGANGIGINQGAVSATRKLSGGLHVLAASGTTPTLDVTIESDVDNTFSTPTTRLTFAQATGLASEWAAPAAGPIADTWWRVVWAVGGGTPSFDFVVFFGIQ